MVVAVNSFINLTCDLPIIVWNGVFASADESCDSSSFLSASGFASHVVRSSISLRIELILANPVRDSSRWNVVSLINMLMNLITSSKSVLAGRDE